MNKKTLCILALVAGTSLATSVEKPRLRYVDPSNPCRRKAATPITGNVRNELTHVADIPDSWNW